jgi:hypothetical protein
MILAISLTMASASGLFLILLFFPSTCPVSQNVFFNGIRRSSEVAASRAKDQLWLFHSVRLKDLTNHDFRYQLLDYIVNYNTTESEQRQLIFVPNPKPRYGEEPKPPNPFRSIANQPVLIFLDAAYLSQIDRHHANNHHHTQ